MELYISYYRIAYNNKPPIFFYANETQKLDGNSMEGAILEAYIGDTAAFLWNQLRAVGFSWAMRYYHNGGFYSA